MHNRESLQRHIVQNGTKISRFRSWNNAAESEKKGLLRQRLPSGYSNWFAIVKNKSIWWIYSDSSDGGVWTSEGIGVNGHWVTYEETLALAIYDLCVPTKFSLYKDVK